jgi:hypothetical protein
MINLPPHFLVLGALPGLIPAMPPIQDADIYVKINFVSFITNQSVNLLIN